MRRTLIRIQQTSEATQPYITLEDSNGEILATTEGFRTSYNARRAAKGLRRRFVFAKIVDAL